jgi:hypothetical protein
MLLSLQDRIKNHFEQVRTKAWHLAELARPLALHLSPPVPSARRRFAQIRVSSALTECLNASSSCTAKRRKKALTPNDRCKRIKRRTKNPECPPRKRNQCYVVSKLPPDSPRAPAFSICRLAHRVYSIYPLTLNTAKSDRFLSRSRSRS